MKTVKILIADDHELFRRGVRAVLESQSGWEVTEAANGQEAIAKAKALQPDLAILAAQMAGLEGPEAGKRIRRDTPNTEILIIGNDESEQSVHRALQGGARAYLTRSTSARDLLDATTSLTRHKPFFNANISEFLLRAYLKGSKPRGKQALTAREKEVLQLVTEGKTNKDIAVITGTSPKTVETHRARIMRKLKVRSVAELVRYAIRNRIIEP